MADPEVQPTRCRKRCGCKRRNAWKHKCPKSEMTNYWISRNTNIDLRVFRKSSKSNKSNRCIETTVGGINWKTHNWNFEYREASLSNFQVRLRKRTSHWNANIKTNWQTIRQTRICNWWRACPTPNFNQRDVSNLAGTKKNTRGNTDTPKSGNKRVMCMEHWMWHVRVPTSPQF